MNSGRTYVLRIENTRSPVERQMSVSSRTPDLRPNIAMIRPPLAALVAAFGLLFLIVPPARADGPQSAALASQALKDFALSSAYAAASGGRIDYSKPPVSEQVRQIFDAQALAALPAPRAGEVAWLNEWLAAATN